ncbi:MAG TPA: DNA replication and repair protein RecF [Verrucomicrobiae bacterium]|nr:DNA replication and repair protein RecF [Verrucomicrobiae bacterium]
MFRRLQLSYFRSYTDAAVDFSPAVTIISGPNGSGKTNILEALYVLSRGSSFRASDSELLQFGAQWWRLAAITTEGDRKIAFDARKDTSRKQVEIEGHKKQRLAASQRLPLVLFEPNDLRLLTGSPARRRDFINLSIAQLEPHYGTQLNKYERALKQRNNLLKAETIRDDELFVWNMLLAELGAAIVTARHQHIARLEARLTEVYRSIAQNNDTITISYSQSPQSHPQQYLLDRLHAHAERDRLYGFTSVGPHRDDILFQFNGSPATAVASRGETRSIVLALKLIEIALVKELLGKKPLLLLDDVFSELDSIRRKALVSVGRDIQTVITTTDADISQEFGPEVRHITLPL